MATEQINNQPVTLLKPTRMNTVTTTAIESALRQVQDPELGCNLVDLGLIYSAEIEGDQVYVRMTLTTMGCPMHESLVEGVRAALLNVEGVRHADVEVVWDPPWAPSMMTPAGRAMVGMA